MTRLRTWDVEFAHVRKRTYRVETFDDDYADAEYDAYTFALICLEEGDPPDYETECVIPETHVRFLSVAPLELSPIDAKAGLLG